MIIIHLKNVKQQGLMIEAIGKEIDQTHNFLGTKDNQVYLKYTDR